MSSTWGSSPRGQGRTGVGGSPDRVRAHPRAGRAEPQGAGGIATSRALIPARAGQEAAPAVAKPL